VEVAEIQERVRFAPFLAHEQHRGLRRQQQQRQRRLDRAGLDEGREAFAKGAVADLVVVLDEIDEGG
jgi:hypothetical protein